MENLTYKNKKKDCTKQEPDTLKKSEVVTNDDRKSKITAPTTGRRTGLGIPLEAKWFKRSVL